MRYTRVTPQLAAAVAARCSGCVAEPAPAACVGRTWDELLSDASASAAESAATSKTEAADILGCVPFLLVWLPTEADAAAVAERCVLLRSVHRLFAASAESPVALAAHFMQRRQREAADGAELLPSGQSRPASHAATADALLWPLRPRLGATRSFRYAVETVERKFSAADKRAVIDLFAVDGHDGPADMRAPMEDFTVFIVHAQPARGTTGGTPFLFALHTGFVCASQRLRILDFYSLKTRPYIGTTSMPPELTFLMSNLAQVRAGDFVMDPFAGTGSSLVSAGHHGGVGIGSDMDGRVLRAGTARDVARKQVNAAIVGNVLKATSHAAAFAKATTTAASDATSGGAESGFWSENGDGAPTMWTNFRTYGLPTVPERMRLNFSLWSRTWRPLLRGATTAGAGAGVVAEGEGLASAPSVDRGFLDAILTDPPYGIREQKRCIDDAATQRRIAARTLRREGAPSEADAPAPASPGADCPPRATSIAGSPDAAAYDTRELLTDLVSFAARALVVGGRLCFWLPTSRAHTDAELPRHPCLALRANIAQDLSLKVTRWLVVMEKTLPCEGANDVARSEVRPAAAAADLRQLVECVAPGADASEAYADYRARREKAWKATAAFHAQQRQQHAREGQQEHATDLLHGADESTDAGAVVARRVPRRSDDGLSKEERRQLQIVRQRDNLAEQNRKRTVVELRSRRHKGLTEAEEWQLWAWGEGFESARAHVTRAHLPM